MIKKNTILFSFITLVMTLFVWGCSKSGGGSSTGAMMDGNWYDITSAEYFVSNNDLTIQFETTDPTVLLSFKNQNSIPLGNTNISYELQNNTCLVTYCYEDSDYQSINGSLTISLDGEIYTVDASGSLDVNNVAKPFEIHYEGPITFLDSNNISGYWISSTNKIVVSPVFSYFESSGGTGRVKVICKDNDITWTVTSNADWCRISSGLNGVGNGNINYTVEQNLKNTNRSATIRVVSEDGKITKRATISQKPGSYDLVVEPRELEFGANPAPNQHGVIHVYVYNGMYPLPWTASCDANWVHLSQSSGNINTDIQVTVDKNTAAMARTAVVTITTDSKTVRTVTINQKPGSGGRNYLIYDGEEKSMTSVLKKEYVDFGWLGSSTEIIVGYDGLDNHNHYIYTVRVQFQDVGNIVPVGTFMGSGYNHWNTYEIVDKYGTSHNASSGSVVTITKDGNSYYIEGSGMADGKSFTFYFKGKL
ncbi:MAG: BACON domain-containing protein [Bacteroidales bacterium]|nr:BACON domain-containing protein [Bacteroidales bacterium]